MGIANAHQNLPEACPNCQYQFSGGEIFCPHCSQKITSGKATFRELFSEFLDALYSLDGRFWRTARHIWIPGKLTVEFFKGKRRSYMHPSRIFLLTAVIHFGFISSKVLNFSNKALSELKSNMDKSVYFNELQQRMDSVATDLKAAYPQPQTRAVLDTFLKKSAPDTTISDQISFLPISSADGKSVNPKAEDLLTLSYDSLCTKYNVKSYWGRISLQQQMRFAKDPGSFPRFVLGNLIWMVLLLIISLAFILKLLYVRHNRYIMEHAFFLFHLHGFAFLVAIPSVIVSEKHPEYILVTMGVIVLFMFFAMKNYYGQGYMKTFVKWVLFNFSYGMLFLFFLIMAFLAGFFLF